MQSALNDLTPSLYDELRRIAGRHLRAERSEHTLQATALVHEVYLKLCAGEDRGYADRTHFLAVASRAMRQVLVDYARARGRKKRDGANLELAENVGLEPVQLLELDRALDALTIEDSALAKIVEMHYFGGMTAEEVADVLGQSVHIVRHDIRLAQAWLRRKLAI